MAQGTHASIWRKFFASSASRGPPSFEWVPAHLDLEEFCLMHPVKPPEWQIGNSWADFFAKVGARSHAVSDTHVEAFAQELRR
eukprot:6589036-Pyramimonas_sp.AAC.1